MKAQTGMSKIETRHALLYGREWEVEDFSIPSQFLRTYKSFMCESEKSYSDVGEIFSVSSCTQVFPLYLFTML